MKISATMRAFLKEVFDRNRSYGQCWRCLEWHRGLVEVEFRGWLCSDCRIRLRPARRPI